MHKTTTLLPIFSFLLLIGHVDISDALKTNSVKCHDRKNFPTCYNNNNLYCPTECPSSCMVDCAKCKPVCLISPPKLLINSKTKTKPNSCKDKNNFPQPGPASNKHHSITPLPPMRNVKPQQPPKQHINFPPHMSFKGYSTPPTPPPKMLPYTPNNKHINFPPPQPHAPIKGYSKPVPVPNKQINFPPPTSLKGGGYSTPPVSTVNTTPSPSPPPPQPAKKLDTESPGLITSTSKASSTPPRTRTAKCRNKNYPKCYLTQHKCPPACPDHCEVDCAKCSPVCSCNYPGSVCKDPKFVGADGLTFYFHGKKNQDFCIVSDPNLHINAHFIGIRNHHMTRDFTWIQSIGIRFGSHNLSVSALPTSAWDDASDRLSISLDGRSDQSHDDDHELGWPEMDPKVVLISRRSTNAVVIEVKDLFEIKANVVAITKRESEVHGYGIDTEKDCFAHLDLSFKFYSLSERVDGVLGQTYASNYVSRVKMGVAMSVLGGNDKFFSTSIFATDCMASQFIISS